MTDVRGKIIGNTIVLSAPPDLPDGSEVLVDIKSFPPAEQLPREPGIVKGDVWMSDDFNDTPPGFEDYMP